MFRIISFFSETFFRYFLAKIFLKPFTHGCKPDYSKLYRNLSLSLNLLLILNYTETLRRNRRKNIQTSFLFSFENSLTCPLTLAGLLSTIQLAFRR